MVAQPTACGECGNVVPYGRLTCPECGEMLASVAGVSRRSVADGTTDEAPAGLMDLADPPDMSPPTLWPTPVDELELDVDPERDVRSELEAGLPAGGAATLPPAPPGAYVPPILQPAGPVAPARAWAGHANDAEAGVGHASAAAAAVAVAVGGGTPEGASETGATPTTRFDPGTVAEFVGWFAIAGAALAMVGFLLPWSGSVIGATGVGYFDRWGFAGPGHILVVLGLAGILAAAILRERVPSWLGIGLPGLGLGALLIGLVWPYLVGGLGAQLGALVVAMGAVLLIVAGIAALVADRHEPGDEVV